MNNQQSLLEFHWISSLGISVALFLISGGLHVLIGALTPLMVDSEFGRKILMMSNRTDAQFFGTEPTTLLEKNPDMVKLRGVMSGFIGGVLVTLGMFIIFVAWFGLRYHQLWSLVALSGTGLLMIPYWYLSFRPYFAAGISFFLSDLPPIFWIPAVFLLPATLLGWLGLR